MKLFNYITLKGLSVILQVFGISMILFSVYAFTGYNAGIANVGLGGPVAIQEENERLGTNYTYTEQFFNFWEGLIMGGCELNSTYFVDDCNRTLGVNWVGINNGQSVNEEVIQGVGNSIFIFIISFMIYSVIGLGLGVIAGVRGGKIDQGLNFITSIMIGIPGILLLIFIFRVFLNMRSLTFNILIIRTLNINSSMSFGDMGYLVIPILSHVFISIPFIFRFIREIVIDERNQLYLRTAKAKGLTETQIIKNHLLPNIYSKMINALSMSIPLGVSSLAFVEFVFGYNGIFRIMLGSVLNYNFPILHAGTLLIGLFTFILMTISNFLSTLLAKLPEETY